jgi:hypothetical protein
MSAGGAGQMADPIEIDMNYRNPWWPAFGSCSRKSSRVTDPMAVA